MIQLILKRANTSRPSGQWRDDDYDVLEAGHGPSGSPAWIERARAGAVFRGTDIGIGPKWNGRMGGAWRIIDLSAITRPTIGSKQR
jgi:hypothetical protein